MSETEYDSDDEFVEGRNSLRRGKWVSGAITLAGAWLVVQALVFELLPANVWNDLVVGGLLIALGGYNFYLRANDRVGSTAAAAVSALLGLWLVVSPWVYGLGNPDVLSAFGFGNDLVVGLLVLVLGAYSVLEVRDVDLATITS